MLSCIARRSSFLIAILVVYSTAAAQPVAFVDEQVIRPADGEDGTVRYAALSPDGKCILYIVRTGKAPSNEYDLSVPAQPVLRRLDVGTDGKAVEFRPNVGRPNLGDFAGLMYTETFSPDGKLLLLPECAQPAPRGGRQRSPVLICQTATGRLARTEIVADLRYARIDGTSKLFFDVDGSAYSLTTGKRVAKLGYRGIVCAANPVAPMLLIDTGMKGLSGPNRVHVWNLRDDRQLATLPTNPRHPYTDDVLPQWTSDGTYVYFIDVTDETDRKEPRITKVWNVKTGQLVGQPFREAIPMAPGPLPGSMFLRQWRGEGPAYALHHAETGTRVELPIKMDDLRDAVGEKIAYFKKLDDKPHLCVATVKWDIPGVAVATSPKPEGKPARGDGAGAKRPTARPATRRN
jgi:hypothetical protein